MRKLFVLIAFTVLLAGCGDSKDDPPSAAATPASTEADEHVDPDLAGYSQGVIDYYREVHTEKTGDDHIDAEIEYHQPPKPAEAGLGETITLTGTNIGVRLKVTPTKIERLDGYTAVRLKLVNDGITVYEAPLQNAALTFADGEAKPVAGRRATCSRQFDPELIRIDVGRTRTGCLLFEGGGDRTEPERLQLALEVVPTTAGGIWNLG